MKRSFTLIELMIGTALAIVVMTASFYLLSNHLKLFRSIDQRHARQQIVSFVLDKISADVQSSKSVSSASTASILVLDLNGNKVSYDYHDGKVRRKIGSSAQYLSDPGDISSLTFRYDGALVEITSDQATTKAFCRNY